MTIPTIRGGRLGAAFALLAVLGGVAPAPASADGHRGGRGHQQAHWRRGYDRHDWRGHPAYEPHPVYAPAPVYEAPQPSPGISLFFPVRIR